MYEALIKMVSSAIVVEIVVSGGDGGGDGVGGEEGKNWIQTCNSHAVLFLPRSSSLYRNYSEIISIVTPRETHKQ